MVLIVMIFVTSASAKESMYASKDERDLACSLKPYKNPKWMSQIELINEKKLHFISVKCMMSFYYKNSKWDDLGIKDEKEPIKALKIQDFNTLEIVDAKEAFYVYGSHIMGPKGDDLIPFKSEKDAINFSKDNGGKKILIWKDFKHNLFKLLSM